MAVHGSPWFGSSLGSPRLHDAKEAGAVLHDADFDRHLPPAIRAASAAHWTPSACVAQVMAWARELGVRRIVDIGSGCGKFCILGALASDAYFIGIERRRHLVSVARALAGHFSVEDRVEFREGDLLSARVPTADLYYLYNPFFESTLPVGLRIDAAVPFSEARREEEILTVQTLLHAAPSGTHLVTNCGFGGHIPPTFSLLRRDEDLYLKLWRKDAPDVIGDWHDADAP